MRNRPPAERETLGIRTPLIATDCGLGESGLIDSSRQSGSATAVALAEPLSLELPVEQGKAA